MKNLRKNPATRGKARGNNCKAMILCNGQRYLAQLLDQCSGGIGILFPIKYHLQIRLKNGQEIKVQFLLGSVEHVDLFIVRTINGERVGLEYADQRHMTPQQRLIASQNIGRR